MKPHQSALDFTGALHFDPQAMAVAPSVHQDARETSALAAIENAQTGRKARQNTAILDLLRAAGSLGMSHFELQRATGYSRQTICARMGFDLKPLLEIAGRYLDKQSTRPVCRWRLKDGTR